jgi:hypothetical protein
VPCLDEPNQLGAIDGLADRLPAGVEYFGELALRWQPAAVSKSPVADQRRDLLKDLIGLSPAPERQELRRR